MVDYCERLDVNYMNRAQEISFNLKIACQLKLMTSVPSEVDLEVDFRSFAW